MSTSIFGALTSYLPTEKRNPREDYLTELFAWLLQNVNKYAESYVSFLLSKMNKEDFSNIISDDIVISTQEVVPSGRIDLLIRMGANDGFVCEHKVYSELSENQIEKYMKYFPMFHSVLVTVSTSQHIQPTDVSLTWKDIHDFTNQFIEECGGEYAVILRQFTTYLKEDVMENFEPITANALEEYWQVMNIENSLKAMFRHIVESKDNWMERIAKPDSFPNQASMEPSLHEKNWGRIGINFFHEWHPNVFAGVLLNSNNHHLEPKDLANGPDFIVLAEVNYDDYDSFRSGGWYREKCKWLTADSGNLDFLPNLPRDKWRVIVLRRPLRDVLDGATTRDEQEQRLIDAMCEGVNLITK